MENLPLLFSFRVPVYGRGFLAGVEARGRALLVKEDGAWWIHGAVPGGMSATGDTAVEASHRFHETFAAILFDIASEAESFDEFSAQAEEFFYETDDADMRKWVAAASDVSLEAHAKAHPFPVASLDYPHKDSLRILRLDQENQSRLTPEQNRLDTFELAVPA